MELDEIIAFVTLVPALAWFVGAFVKIYQMYKKNEVKIKTAAQEQTQKLKETAEDLKEKVEQGVEKTLHKEVTSNESQIKPETEDGSQPH